MLWLFEIFAKSCIKWGRWSWSRKCLQSWSSNCVFKSSINWLLSRAWCIRCIQHCIYPQVPAVTSAFKFSWVSWMCDHIIFTDICGWCVHQGCTLSTGKRCRVFSDKSSDKLQDILVYVQPVPAWTFKLELGQWARGNRQLAMHCGLECCFRTVQVW